MVEAAFASIVEQEDGKVEAHVPVEVHPTDAGDFAVSWSVFYHTKDVKNLLRNQQYILSMILQQAASDGISLATPILNSISGNLEQN